LPRKVIDHRLTVAYSAHCNSIGFVSREKENGNFGGKDKQEQRRRKKEWSILSNNRVSATSSQTEFVLIYLVYSLYDYKF